MPQSLVLLCCGTSFCTAPGRRHCQSHWPGSVSSPSPCSSIRMPTRSSCRCASALTRCDVVTLLVERSLSARCICSISASPSPGIASNVSQVRSLQAIRQIGLCGPCQAVCSHSQSSFAISACLLSVWLRSESSIQSLPSCTFMQQGIQCCATQTGTKMNLTACIGARVVSCRSLFIQSQMSAATPAHSVLMTVNFCHTAG